ncbi:hypothetical protein [Sciscionella marina]|uniref:hypothetical protein n=1 Tax=Sciscionella marina TaxID=508770 RepID=UPI00035CF9F2|nr:hypothetical protein [Sciscionella marina]
MAGWPDAVPRITPIRPYRVFNERLAVRKESYDTSTRRPGPDLAVALRSFSIREQLFP